MTITRKVLNTRRFKKKTKHTDANKCLSVAVDMAGGAPEGAAG